MIRRRLQGAIYDPSGSLFWIWHRNMVSHMTPTKKGEVSTQILYYYSPIRPGTCPAPGGTKPSPPGGGRAASIAFVIQTRLLGHGPSPLCRLWAEYQRHPPRRGVCCDTENEHHLCPARR